MFPTCFPHCITIHFLTLVWCKDVSCPLSTSTNQQTWVIGKLFTLLDFNISYFEPIKLRYSTVEQHNFTVDFIKLLPKYSKFHSKFCKSIVKSKVHNLLKLANWFCKQAFDWVILIHGSIRGFVYIPSFEFQHELLNFATNLRTLERNLEYLAEVLWNQL